MSHCVIEDVTDQVDPTVYDKVLGDLLVQHDSNSNKFLQTVFGFLKRKTNFYKEGDAKKKILDAYREVTAEDEGLKSGFLSKPLKPEVPKAEPQAPLAPAPAPIETHSAVPDVPVPEVASEAVKPVEDLVPEPPVSTIEEDVEEDDKPKGIKPNAARGADFATHSWGQTLTEVSVTIPIPKGTRAKQLDVFIGKNKLRVGIKGQAPIIEGELSEPVKPDDCLWNLADNTIEISMQKADGMHWWGGLVKGDPVIDTQKVEPENSKLGDLDPETRQTVEKMMFDQRQKALGLPTTEELQKQAMLKKFMSAHPEMDFSSAKIM